MGKSRASRNAVRHGLEAASLANAEHSAQVERLAKKICQDASDPFRYEQAVIIADSEIFLVRVRATRIAAIERFRKAVARLWLLPGLPTPEEKQRMFSDLEQGNLWRVIKVLNHISEAAKKLVTDTTRAEQHRSDLIRQMKILREWSDKSTPEAPDEIEYLARALPELLSLERYERRALSRRRRAIRRFDVLGD
jgi:hypothetical protein